MKENIIKNKRERIMERQENVVYVTEVENRNNKNVFVLGKHFE